MIDLSDLADLDLTIRDCHITITPALLGAAFARMDTQERVEFFASVYKVASTGDSGPRSILQDLLRTMADALEGSDGSS